MKHKIFTIVVMGLVAIALVYSVGCTVKAENNSNFQQAVSVPILTITTKDTILDREYIASIRAVRNVEIRSHMKGFLEQIYVDEGRWVKKGQPLFRLNDQELKAQLKEAQANQAITEAEMQTASLEVNRVKILVEKRVVSETELALAEAKFNAARSRVQQAKAVTDNIQIRIGYTLIKAPFDGIIDRIPMKVGSLVTEGDLLTTFSDIQQMHAYFEVSENEYLALSKGNGTDLDPNGTPVRLTLSDGTNYPVKGKIETMSSEFGQSTGSIAFRARFANPNYLLKHGASGKIFVTKPQNNVVMIPQTAVFEIQDKSYVYVIDKNNIARIRSFVPRTRAGQNYIVQSGLNAGERITTEGVQLIKDGTLIKPR